MTRLVGLFAAVAITIAAAALGVANPAASALEPGRGQPGYCPSADGVTVVVDFQDLGGPVIIRCAPGSQATGLDALRNAGLTVTGVQRWGMGFVCRLESKPGPDREACIDTPPASAYWSYWHAPNGGRWTYSSYGVMNRKPPVGSFEGWSFSYQRAANDNPVPRIAPTRPGQPVGQAPPPAQQDGAIPGRDGAPQQVAPVPQPAPQAQQPAPQQPIPMAPPPAPTSAPAVAPPSSTSAGPDTATSETGGVIDGIEWTGGRAAPAEPARFPWGAVAGAGVVTVVVVAAVVASRRRARDTVDGVGS